MKNSFFTRLAAVGALCCAFSAFASNVQAQTLHLVTVGNPAAFTARTAIVDVRNDVKNVRAFFTERVPASRLRLLDLQDPTAADVEAALAHLAVESDDVVVFYFTGHAGNQLDAEGQVFQLFQNGGKNETRLSRRTVRRVLAPKEPRFVVLLTDCANAFAPSPESTPIAAQVESAQAPAEAQAPESDGPEKVSPVVRRLFFEPSGCVDMTAAKPGQYAFADAADVRGSIATNAWLSVFKEVDETLKNDPKTEIDWREVSEKMIAETEKRFQKKYPDGTEVVGDFQGTQTPHVYELPGAPRLGARVQMRQKENVVTEIVADSPADKAGMQVGDVLVAIRYLDTMEEIRPHDEADYADAIDYAPRDVDITVKRQNSKPQLILTVELNGAPLKKAPQKTDVSPRSAPRKTPEAESAATQPQPAPQKTPDVESAAPQPQPAPRKTPEVENAAPQPQPAQPDPNGPVCGATVQGQTIVEIVPNSPAAIAGLQVGDRMLSFNGKTISNGYDYAAAVDSAPADTNVFVLRVATGAQATFLLRLNKNANATTQPTQPQPDPNGPVFGATVQGQEITVVVPNSPASIAGLKVGEKILVFNGEPMENAFDYSKAVDKSDVEAFLRVLGLDGVVRDVFVNLNKK